MADIRQTTVFLDRFDRANEDPLSNGGKWSQTDSGAWTPMVLKTNTATHKGGGATNSDSYWNVQTWSGNEAEVWGAPVGGNASGIAWALDLFQASSVGGVNAVDGYRFRSDVTSGGAAWNIYIVTNGVRTRLGASGPVGISAGFGFTRMLFRRNGNDLEGWYSQDSGANWSLALTRTDATYTGPYYLGIGINDNSGSQILGWNDFGGGAGQNRPQIYRWIKN